MLGCDDQLFMLLVIGATAGVGYVVGQLIIVAATVAWDGIESLIFTIQQRKRERQEAIRTAEQAIKDKAHRAWFVAEMRRDPNAFGGNHHEWEFRPGE